MSFANDVKNEITSKELPKKQCCRVAAAYGIACFGKYFDERGIVLHTENDAVAQYAKKIMEGIEVKGAIEKKGKDSKVLYEFSVKQKHEVAQILKTLHSTHMQTTLKINSDNFECESCVNAFVSSAFLCCGTMTNPEKDYNLEFVTNKYTVLNDLRILLMGHNFTPHLVQRKGLNVLYLKSSEQIEDLLTFMGASKGALLVMDLKIYKDLRNKANRITNCETANIDKTVAANEAALGAIYYLEQHSALTNLSDDLKNTALLRKENPSLSLKELAGEFSPPISKSGLAHRLKKLVQLAEDMKMREKQEKV